MLDAAALRRLWPEILEVVKDSSRTARALLDNAQITDAEGELVTLSSSGPLAKMIAEDRNTSVLKAAMTKVVGGSWRIQVVGAAPGASAAPAQGARGRSAAASAPEPDPRDDEPEPAGDDETAAPRAYDPEVEAVKLLRDRLGARPLEG